MTEPNKDKQRNIFKIYVQAKRNKEKQRHISNISIWQLKAPSSGLHYTSNHTVGSHGGQPMGTSEMTAEMHSCTGRYGNLKQ